MLNPIPQLAKDDVRNVERVLRHEINSYAFGANQPDNLFDLLEERLGRFVEKKVGFVKEEYELGLVQISSLRKLFEQL